MARTNYSPPYIPKQLVPKKGTRDSSVFLQFRVSSQLVVTSTAQRCDVGAKMPAKKKCRQGLRLSPSWFLCIAVHIFRRLGSSSHFHFISLEQTDQCRRHENPVLSFEFKMFCSFNCTKSNNVGITITGTLIPWQTEKSPEGPTVL